MAEGRQYSLNSKKKINSPKIFWQPFPTKKEASLKIKPTHEIGQSLEKLSKTLIQWYLRSDLQLDILVIQANKFLYYLNKLNLSFLKSQLQVTKHIVTDVVL